MPSTYRVPRATLASAIMLLATACAGHSGAPGTGAPPANGPAISADDLRHQLFAFSDDSMLGREAGTLGNVKATDYIAREAKRLGLLPAGENGTYFQTVPMGRRIWDTTSSMRIDGTPLAWQHEWLPLASRGAQSAFRPAGSATALVPVFGGRAGDTSVTLTAAQTAGRLVVLDAPLGAGGRPTATFRGAVDRYPQAAAIAVVTLDLMTPAMLSTARTPLIVLPPGDGPPDHRPLGASIAAEVATRLFGAPTATLTPGTVGRGTIDLTVRVTESPTAAPARNVVAILPGSDPTLRGEYVAIGAHSDHLGVAPHAVDFDSLRAWNTARWQMASLGSGPTPTMAEQATIHVNADSLHRLHPARRDSVYNGADDDGSGTVAVLELARAFTRAPARPKRSILFVWHTGEEKGLLGSAWYTDHPTVPRDSIVAQLNMDMVGRGDSADWKGGGPRYLLLVGSRRLSTELGDLVETVNAAEPAPLAFDYTLDANGHPENVYCRSDHYEYARYGIPIVFFTTGLHQDYHQVTDEAQFIDYPHMARVVQLVYDVAVRVANLDHRPVVDKPKPDPHGVCRQ